MAAPADLERRQAVLDALTRLAEQAARIPLMADLGADLGLVAREVRRQMGLLEREGAIMVERRGEGTAQTVRVILPGGVLATQWSPVWESKNPRRQGTARIFALLADVARRGDAAPTNKEIGQQLGIDRGLVQSAINNLATSGRIKVHRTGTIRDGTRQFEIDGHRTAASPRSIDPARRTTPRATPAVIAGFDPPRPDQPIIARRLPRCPYCEMPARHRLCRHGWNGITTRAQRTQIAIAAGHFGKLPRMAVDVRETKGVKA